MFCLPCLISECRIQPWSSTLHHGKQTFDRLHRSSLTSDQCSQCVAVPLRHGQWRPLDQWQRRSCPLCPVYLLQWLLWCPPRLLCPTVSHLLLAFIWLVIFSAVIIIIILIIIMIFIYLVVVIIDDVVVVVDVVVVGASLSTHGRRRCSHPRAVRAVTVGTAAATWPH